MVHDNSSSSSSSLQYGRDLLLHAGSYVVLVEGADEQIATSC
jgi:hypothetical protein